MRGEGDRDILWLRLLFYWGSQHRSHISLRHSDPSMVVVSARRDSNLSCKTRHKSSHKVAASAANEHDCRSSHQTKHKSSHKVAASAAPRHEHDCRSSCQTKLKFSHKVAASAASRHEHDCTSSRQTKCKSSHKMVASSVPRHEHDCTSSRKTKHKCSHRVAASAAPRHQHDSIKSHKTKHKCSHRVAASSDSSTSDDSSTSSSSSCHSSCRSSSSTSSSSSSCSSSAFCVWEMCCHPRSTITHHAKKYGLHAKRVTLETGYNFKKKGCVSKVLKKIRKSPPSKVWVSIPCTAWSSIQNFNRKPSQQKALAKKRKTSRQLLRNVLKVLKMLVGISCHIYFEWPTRCQGWRLPELSAFRVECIARGHAVHNVKIDGCMYNLMSREEPGLRLRKSWTILTTDPAFESACSRRCDGGHQHRVIGGKDTCHSGFYPESMGRAITKHWASSI